MNVFDFLNSINYTKKNILEEDILLEKQYVPFIINKYFYNGGVPNEQNASTAE